MTALQQTLSLQGAADAIKKEWDQGVEPDARAALARRPELRVDKAVVLDLAYEEYCWRCEAGRPPDPEDFCNRFPTFRSSVHRLVAAHHWLGEHASSIVDDVRPMRWPAPGDRLGDLVLLRELGRGSFARVFLAAEESAGGRPVAVKLSAQGAAEARTLGPLAHPNIVPVLSARFEQSVGLTAVCMPFLGAATLTDVLDKAYPHPDAPPPRHAAVIRKAIRAASRAGDPAPLSPLSSTPSEDSKATRNPSGAYVDEVVRLGAQVADALAFLHGKGLIHRDLKPDNVLLSPDGQALLLDFNLTTDARAAFRHEGGTLPYMAPEQLGASVADGAQLLDQRLDLFALGVILYELLAGRHPFGAPPVGQAPRQAALALRERQRKGCIPLRTVNPAVDRRVARLVQSCLAFEPTKRPASAAVLAQELRRCLSLSARIRRRITARPWATAAVVGLALLAAGAAAAETANQTPAHVRDYEGGRSAYAAGDYAGAEHWFSQALQDCPARVKPVKYYLARGEAALRLAEAADNGQQAKALIIQAREDLDEARQQQPDGAILARLGYCSSRAGELDDAVYWFDQAAAAGFTSAGLLNDRAVSRLAHNRLQEARQDLDEAVRLEPNLQAARLNRALLGMRQRPIADWNGILDDIRAAVDAGPCSQELYLTAAQMFASAAKAGNPEESGARKEQALAFLQQAVEQGVDRGRIRNDPVFSVVLQRLPQFQTILDAPAATTVAPATTPRFVDPAPYLPDW